MRRAPFELALLDAAHDRTLFRNDLPPLERCLREQVTQDTCPRVAACFVALASSKKLPRYPSMPAVRMDRLAVDQTFKRKGLDSALLADALERELAAPRSAPTRWWSMQGVRRQRGFTGITASFAWPVRPSPICPPPSRKP